MFKADAKHVKSEQTREEILDSALELFRQHGFDATTMRDIAVKAGVALGAAYYYFASKDAIVQAYYEKVQQEHTARLRQMKMDGLSLRQRLAAVFYSKLDILENDRKLLGAIFRYSGEPAHPLRGSVLFHFRPPPGCDDAAVGIPAGYERSFST